MNTSHWLICFYVCALLFAWKYAVALFQTFDKMDETGKLEDFRASWLKFVRVEVWRLPWLAKLSVLVGLGLGMLFAPTLILVSFQLRIEDSKSKEVFPMGILKALSWFLRGEAREPVELSRADLRRDLRAMRKEKRSWVFILAVVTWRTLETAVPIMCDGVVRVCYKLAPVAWLLGLLR